MIPKALDLSLFSSNKLISTNELSDYGMNDFINEYSFFSSMSNEFYILINSNRTNQTLKEIINICEGSRRQNLLHEILFIENKLPPQNK